MLTWTRSQRAWFLGAFVALSACQLDTSVETLRIDPSAVTIAADEEVTLTALLGRAGVERPATGVTWTSVSPTIASVTDGADGTAVVRGRRGGRAIIVASIDGLEARTTIEVSTVTLTGITVTPVDPSIADGTTVPLTATATFSDGTTSDITSAVTWFSSNETLASVARSGVVTGVAPGTATITARMGSASGSTVVTVTDATLIALAVTPTDPTIAAGFTQALTATGTFSDGTTQDLTTQVTWSSATLAVATISNAAGSEGIATGIAPGTSLLTATRGALSASTQLAVTAALLTAIEVAPAAPTVAAGLTLRFSATGTFSDGTSQDLTTQVTWASSDESVATVSNAAGNEGRASALTVGATNITATFVTVTGTTRLAVSDAELVSLEITPIDPSVARGFDQAFAATGTFTDGTVSDVTDQATWSVEDARVAIISNAAGTRGLATTGEVGSTRVTASLLTVSASTTLTVTAATLVRLEITPVDLTVPRGLTRSLTATGVFSDASTADLTASVTWSSDAPAVASVSNAAGSEGLASALTVGSATITATQGTLSASTSLTVSAAALVSIEVTPVGVSLPRGRTQSFTATGIFTDGSNVDLTTSVTWSSDALAVATVSNAGGTEGRVQAVDVGSATITATSGSVSGSTTVTVTSAVLVSLEVTPASPSIARGRSQAFSATGTFSDGSTRDLTTTVTWSSSTTGTATISNASGSEGVATGVNVGSTTITASSGPLSASTTLGVTSAVLVSLEVTPTNPSIARGRTVQLTATGTFSDATTQDLTASVTWSSSMSSVATVSNAVGTWGLASGANVGSTTIGASSGAISGTTLLTVTSAVLVSIDVTPASPSIARGRTQQLTATGTFSDASTMDLTTTVTWSSSMTGVATVSNATGSEGLASGANVGSTLIRATSGTVSGSTTLTVTAAVLVSLDVTPALPSIARGRTQAFVATGTFSDASTMDLTSTVTWSSSDPSVAPVSNAAGSQGLASGASVGATTVTATSGSISGSTMLTVTSAVLVSIAVTPVAPSLSLGFTEQLTATGTFSDASTMDLTSTVAWSSSNTAVGTVSNATGSEGLASGVMAGTTTVTATSGAISGSTLLTVTPAVLVSIAVSPANPSVPLGLTQPFTAIGTYSDASTADLSTQVTWSSGDVTVATISNAAGSEGLATTASVGPTNIVATFGAVVGSTNLTVSAAVLVSLAVTPVTPSIALGQTQAFVATGTMSDASTMDLTTAVTWSSADPSVAAISNAAGSEGLATALSVGTSVVGATLGAIAGSTTLTVNAAVPVSLSITPEMSTVNVGQTVQYTAIATLSDSTTMDVTSTVSWASSSLVASVGVSGLATTASAGTTTITGTLGSLSDTASLTANAVAPTVVSIAPADGGASVPASSSLVVTFDTAMNLATLTTQSGSGACTGALQISSDGFASCIGLTSVVGSSGDTVATFGAAPGLAYGTTYRVRVTTAVESAGGTSLASTVTQATGFTTGVDARVGPSITGAVPTGLVLSQVYGAGGNAGATYTHDFVEIFNPTSGAISVTGMAIQYASTTGSTWSVTSLTGSIPAGGFYLVQLGSAGANGVALPAPNATGTTAMAGAAGKVALTSTTSALSGSCPTGGTVVDFVGYGTGTNCFEGAVTPSLSATLSATRRACQDTANNGADFTTAVPAPRNAASSAIACNATANETSTARELDYCVVQFPPSLSVAASATTPTIYARVFEAGVTEAGGASTAMRAEIGYGPTTVNPEYESGFAWTSAPFNTQVGNDDEYGTTLTAPTAGTYRYAARFSLDGTNWTYCDLDGAGSNAFQSFDPVDIATMTVTP